MIRIGLIGVGRMGISHLAIANAHPDVEIAYICDRPGPVPSAIKAYTAFPRFSDYRKAIAEGGADAVIVATPTGTHDEVSRAALGAGQHVFVEKPFSLDPDDGDALAALAEEKGLVNQVGYHNRFIGTFGEARRLLADQVLGRLHHAHGEAYGQVVTRPQSGSWRFSSKKEGGCLLDYASHVIDLMNFLIGPPKSVSGSVLQSIYSRDVDDAVYASLGYDGFSGQLSVNWSDETYRKMTTRVSVQGDLGKITVDRQELRIYLRDARPDLDLKAGWNIRYITELTAPVWFYLRGEEYSAQLAAFVAAIQSGKPAVPSTFRTATETDRVVAMIRDDAEGRGGAPATQGARQKGFFGRLFGGGEAGSRG
ncbi:MAG: Gfo/Idh/MocA family protein [Alphaproteobacteria bacterium]